LKKSMQSYYNYIKTPFEVVIVDFGSTYEPTVKFLQHLENEKVKVYWQERITSPPELNKANECIQDYFKSHPKSNYVVTDPDVALDNVDGDILGVYSYLLENLPKISVVGPMLRIDDIPDHYPRKKELLSTSLHVNFHSRKVNIVQYKDKTIRFIFAPIDTTFAMNRAGKRWARLRKGIRTLSPYSARHLDWYFGSENLTPDQKYYAEYVSGKIAHWSKWNPMAIKNKIKEEKI